MATNTNMRTHCPACGLRVAARPVLNGQRLLGHLLPDHSAPCLFSGLLIAQPVRSARRVGAQRSAA